MLTTVIVMVRPAANVPYYFETVDARKIYATFMPLRAAAPGFLGMVVERAPDDLSIMHRLTWESMAQKIAFERQHAALMEEIQTNLKEYNLLNGITRKAASRRDS
jgi:hypothetical protein